MRSLRHLMRATFVAIAAAGCGSGGATLNCPAAPNTCDTAVDLGEIIGDDTNTVPITQMGSGAAFVSVLVQEASFDNTSISVRGTIASIDQTNYDLLLYVPATDNGPACGAPPITSVNNVVDANWPDTYDGSSQDRRVVFQIRPRSGTCGGGWVLVIQGNTTSVTMP